MNSRSGFLVAFALGLATPVAVWQTVSAQSSVNPHGDLKADCGSCHTPAGWKPVSPKPSFKHETTGFVLREAHAQVSCLACHRSLVFSKVGTACADCHRDAHRGDLGFRCEDCHDQQSWTNLRQMRERHNRTRLPLIGVHANLDCDSCHRGAGASRYALAPTTCGACHVQTYLNAKNPDHSARGFSRRCEDCHTLFGWRPATGVDHNATRFPLTGLHQTVSCAQCHVGGRFAGTPTDCFSCHQARYNATSNPNHVASNFPRTCQDCHSTTAWRPAASIDHSRTRFPLTGAHQGTDCARCHVGGRFTGTPTDCLSCHEPRYNATSNPNHVASNFPKTCEDCHSTTAWRPAAALDHNRTRFPLTGAHQRTDCARCHVGGRFTGTPTDCLSCHQTNYNSTSNPNHTAANFPKTCQDCHSTSAWRPAASIDHSRTRFPLTGAHQGADCARCHVGGRFAGTPTDCVSCHQTNFNSTTNPNHVAGNYPRTCQDCHSTSAWRPAANIDHSRTRFPLTGAHQGTDCARCHTNGRFTGTPTDCVSCHQTNFNNTTNPNHRTAGFPTGCQTCHSTSGWRPATFDHNTTRFALTGAHRSVDCARCHTNGRYAGTPSTCVSCHQSSYDRTTNPNHRASGFPTDCQSCHTTTTWQGATFDHSRFFPIASGRHRGISCATCHTNSGNYSVFSCLNGCHGRTSTDNQHRGRSGYSYDSSACYRCHPRG
jgi:hypothetical protein